MWLRFPKTENRWTTHAESPAPSHIPTISLEYKFEYIAIKRKYLNIFCIVIDISVHYFHTIINTAMRYRMDMTELYRFEVKHQKHVRIMH